ncbi:metallophosphoesterase [Vibrio hibernica]|uniref:metallophosphoesterase n=1 Tax=Vibrio hibernica TaxID=2587465 RepID=UPI0039AEFB2A
MNSNAIVQASNSFKNTYKQAFFIGDIHGQSHKLEQLLKREDLLNDKDQTKIIIFIGDLIDNRDNVDHIAVLERVKSLVDQNRAICIMGNHEFNAVGWCTQLANGEYARSRNKTSNQQQHHVFLDEVTQDSAAHLAWVEWFKTLPLFVDLGTVTAIHAYWNDVLINELKPYLTETNALKSEHWENAFDPNHPLYGLCEKLLKGPEIDLPDGVHFLDKHGTKRTQTRIAWWIPKEQVTSFTELGGMLSNIENTDTPVEDKHLIYHLEPQKPVVVGHYTLKSTNTPKALSEKVACVDFSGYKQDNPLVGLWVDLSDQEIKFKQYDFRLSPTVDIHAKTSL